VASAAPANLTPVSGAPVDGSFFLTAKDATNGIELFEFIPPTLAISGAATLDPSSTTPYTLNLTANDSGGTINNVIINWGDGTTQTLSGAPPASVTHTFPLICNSYIISATINDSSGTYSASGVANLTAMLPSQNQCFVAQVYQDVLGRAADAPGLAFWSGLLDQGTANRTAVVLAIEQTKEARNFQVQALYNELLHRKADKSGLKTFTNFLMNGGTLESVAAMIAGSPEYFVNRGGSTSDGFLDALYQDVLHRSVDSSGRTAFNNALSAGTTTLQQVASAIFASPEYQQDLVSSFYLLYLHRPVDVAGLNAFTNALQGGATDELVIAEIVGSSEYASSIP